MIDYRFVAFGAVLPVGEAAFGRAMLFHTLLGAAIVLTIVMLATRGRRLVRRQWLGLPVGLLLHLVLDGTWTSKTLMWWPIFGFRFADPVPEFHRSPPVMILLEVIGIGAGVWAVRRYELNDRVNRDRFLHSGQLARGVV
jgi:membrane-bound metal-dependent hydrolase YbcI (DUF457 family)